jgi:hypothetical protein
MATERDDDLYLLNRDAEETERHVLSRSSLTEHLTDINSVHSRLNKQHQYLTALSNGHLLHPSIPIENIESVADIATGTG